MLPTVLVAAPTKLPATSAAPFIIEPRIPGESSPEPFMALDIPPRNPLTTPPIEDTPEPTVLPIVPTASPSEPPIEPTKLPMLGNLPPLDML